MRFKRSIEPFERFSLRTRIAGYDEKWLWIEQRFISTEGRCKACGITKVALRSNSSGFAPPREMLVQRFGEGKVNLAPFEPGALISKAEPMFGRDV